MSDEATTRAEVLERVQSIASDILNLPGLQMSEQTTAQDVPGWDSLTHVQIIVGVEQAFGIRMTSTEVAQLDNAGSLVDVILAHRSRAAGA
ncbi:acyl carrier protein [Sphingomonas sp. LHG3443-2]|uniref:acyl carrier protein n=1 Tax=Sphingomonas sp. LHG3443-2 TaxID=2804639 RepID=UPI003CF95933